MADFSPQYLSQQTVSRTLKDGTPTDDELEGLAKEIVEWEKLGRRLGVSDPKLEEINQARNKLSEKGYHMLKHWKQENGSSATYKALCDALRHKFIQRKDLAERFCYINGNTRDKVRKTSAPVKMKPTMQDKTRNDLQQMKSEIRNMSDKLDTLMAQRETEDEGKEIALPGEVQESLVSQSCDAKDVVLQLKKQLDRASLEQPDPRTKTLIRCLARKAKDFNRPDVFQHLREITPAGTTGPLLSEDLDVQDIPVSKRKELTIDLSGGDEWKAVAERLGLTSQEIRYLDSRTRNPFEAVLDSIPREHNITVADLYDLLNECGFPAIADLL